MSSSQITERRSRFRERVDHREEAQPRRGDAFDYGEDFDPIKDADAAAAELVAQFRSLIGLKPRNSK